MSNPAKPVWPDLGALPFSLFGNSAASPSPPALGQPFVEGIAGGVDFVKKLWGNVPGNTAVPGFLLPTLDIEELDKRISDLKAAESWLEVNLNLLRATIQGLEVQRHTIAAIRSLGAVAEPPKTSKAASSAPPTPSGLPPGWPIAQPQEDTRSTQASATQDAMEAASAAPAEVDRSDSGSDEDSPDSDGDADASEAIVRRPGATKKPVGSSKRASVATSETPIASAGKGLAGLTANNWLGYMQDQFAKVAQAALASSEVSRANEGSGTGKQTAPAKGASKKASKKVSKPASKTTAKRRPPARKKRTAR